MICAPKMAHFYKLMQQELFLQSCSCKAFEVTFMSHLAERRRDGEGRNYSGCGTRGAGGPPPGAKVWVSQSWPTQTLTRESSSPLRILCLWLDKKGSYWHQQFLEVCFQKHFLFFVSILYNHLLISSSASDHLQPDPLWHLTADLSIHVKCDLFASAESDLSIDLKCDLLCSLTRTPIPSTKWARTKTSDMLSD